MKEILTKKDGEVSMNKSFDYLCSLLRNGVYIVEIRRKSEPRTVSQNSLMWMWFTYLEDATGTPKKDWHDYYCSKYLVRVVEVKGRAFNIVGGTKYLNTIQFTKFMNQVQADVATEFGITLPLPADRHYSDFINEYLHQ